MIREFKNWAQTETNRRYFEAIWISKSFPIDLGQSFDCNLHLGDLSALMIASEDGESILEADLKGNKKSHSLNWVVTTVDIVAHEQIVRVRRLSTNFEKLSEVMELTVDVSADCDGSTDLLDVRLVNKDFFRLNRIQKLTDVQNCLVLYKSATNVSPHNFSARHNLPRRKRKRGCRTWKLIYFSSRAYFFTKSLDLLLGKWFTREKNVDLLIKVFDVVHVEIVLFHFDILS